MPLPPEAVEALDDATAPERLAELAERFPQLQSLVVANAACPPETRERILASNPAAAEVYAAAQKDAGAGTDAGAGGGDAAPSAGEASAGPAPTGAEADEPPAPSWGTPPPPPADADPAPTDDASEGRAPDHAASDPAATGEDDAWSILAPVLGDRDEDTATDPMDPVADESTQAMAPLAPDDEPTRAIAAVGPDGSPRSEPDDEPTRAVAAVDDDATRIAPVEAAPRSTVGMAADADAPTEVFAPVDAPIAGSSASAVAPEPDTTPADVPPLPRVTGYLDSIPTAAADDEPVEAYGTIASPTGYGTTPSPAGYGTPAAAAPAAAAPMAASTGFPAAASPAGYSTAPSPAGYGTPAPAPGLAEMGTADTGSSHRGRGGLMIAIGCLVAAFLLALAVLGGGLLLSRDDTPQADPSASASESAAPEETSSGSESASPSTTSASTQALVKPAPADAQELTQIQSPSDNIVCTLENGTVGCTVIEYTPSGESCPAGQSYTIAVADGAPALDCGSPRPAGGTKLEYGSSAVQGDMACTSAKSGMTCWNQRTGHGFTLSKKQQTTF
ncbi:hypothetical protein [Brachybacterium nesterenkovii]|uniref:Fe-S oxidoreductase n=1 Tax=Brachybacterium nesterenkovii TaxID=47847 RepID=A0A1X6X9U3_9MICO|nr:hypothetical protein [Brachybacterium nesterenkovii]SLM95909.1 Fe-S oxidoreductase [Brachybacterium nesterenkovii]